LPTSIHHSSLLLPPLDDKADAGRVSCEITRAAFFHQHDTNRHGDVSKRYIIQTDADQTLAKKLARAHLRRVIKLIIIVIKWMSSVVETKESGKTYIDIAREAVNQDATFNFDLSYYKAKTELNITREVKDILSLPPSSRSPAHIVKAILGLRHIESFAEYPEYMQEMLCKVGWFQSVSPGRVIIRQGHLAENFYFLLSGKVIVRFFEHNPLTGENQLRTAAVLRKGSSFGELALLHHSRRTATVVSEDGVQLLTIGRNEFFTIIMGQHSPGQMPDHVQFLRSLEFMKDWPIEKLSEFPECCILHYFKRTTVMVRDSNKSDWLYIVKSGSCQVIKQLFPTKRSHMQRKITDEHKKYSSALRAASAFAELSLSKRKSHGQLCQVRYMGSSRSDFSSETKPVVQKWISTECTPVFVQVEILKTGEVFGLRTLNFEQEYESAVRTSVSLVSNGAECVMLSRKLFMDNASPDVQRLIRHQIQPYPSDSVLHENYQTKMEWLQFKRRLVQQCTNVHGIKYAQADRVT
jgi:CRP-like cAMP-binding protein